MESDFKQLYSCYISLNLCAEKEYQKTAKLDLIFSSQFWEGPAILSKIK